MKNFLKKILESINKWFKVLLVLSLILIMFFIVLAGYLLLTDNELIKDSVIVNRLAIMMGVFSFILVIYQLVEVLLIKKKEFIVDTKCPKCRHAIQYTMKEK
jgi:hypothetical protein